MDNATKPAIERRLEVFVSSTIQECAGERLIAKEAITSLNFDPVLFEKVGARPYPPRELYESRLRASEIFIAIYRDQYGWIAPGAEVSGIEDEFNIAEEAGLPRLVYILGHPSAREERLTALVNRAKEVAGLTVWHYSDPRELHDRIREDITALVSRNFRLAAVPGAASADDNHDLVSRIVPEAERFRRPVVERELLDALQSHRIVQVTGEMGIGKTILLALLAADQQWIHVSGRSKTPTELAQTLMMRFADALGEPQVPRLGYQASIRGAATLLKRLRTKTIAIDDCPTPTFVEELLDRAGADLTDVSLVFVLRPLAESAFSQFRVPTLTDDEIVAGWRARFGKAPSATQVRQLAVASQGLPLYLRYLRFAEELELSATSLSVLELRRWRELSGLAQDVIVYVALSDVPLSLADLIALTQTDESDKRDLLAATAEAGALVVETDVGVLPAHEHVRETIRAHCAESPVRHSYYAGRVAAQLQSIGEYTATFMVLDRSGSAEAARWSAQAAAQASREGDLRNLRHVLERRVSYRDVQADRPSLAATLMALAQAEDMAGDYAAAALHWQQAEALAAEAAVHLIPEIRLEQLTRRALKSTTPEQIAELTALRDEQVAGGDLWMAARVALDLSVIQLRGTHAADAAENARMAEKGFAEAGDEHGVRLAKRNLASALTISDSPEGEALVAEIAREETVDGTARTRAWLCNVMCRSMRRRGDPKGAQALAEEAVEIGKRLGDPFVTSTNSINVGNCLRDQNLLDEALAAYDSAGREAQKIQARSIDASAAWHAADILNRQELFARALQYAEYAIGLTTGTSFNEDLSHGHGEKAYALHGLDRKSEAASEYLKAAMALSVLSDRERRAWLLSLAARLWYDLDDRDQYLREFSVAYDSVADGPAAAALALLSKLADEVTTNHLLRVFGIHFRFMLNEVPDPVARRFFRLSIKRLLGQPDKREGRSEKRVLPLIPLLAALPGKALTLPLMIEFGDAVNDALAQVSFRPRNDLAALYVTRLGLGSGVIMSFEQIDDRPETAAVTALLAMFFLGFQERISEEIFGAAPPVRSELHLGIIAHSEAAQLIPQMTLSGEAPFAVTRPTSLEGTLPTYIVYRDNLLERSATTDAGRNDLLALIAQVLVEVAFQLLRKEVDEETLRPAVRSIVTKLA